MSTDGSTAFSNHAFVTPSYPFDLDRCALLIKSLDHCCPQARHYIIVDRHDIRQFAHLASDRTILIESEEVVDHAIRRLPGGRGFWFSTGGLTRGWIMQQIRKIAVSRAVSEENLIFCDSDMAFIRPFDENALLVNGSLGLLDVDFENAETREWTRIARRLLGLSDSETVRGHVGQLICWKRDVLIAMQERIESVQKMPWQRALAKARTVSEYILYGVFVRECIGYDRAGQAPSQVPLVKTSWDSDITDPVGLRLFFDTIEHENIAVMAHSRDPVDWDLYRELLRSQWQREGVA
jgi:Family of unknown function (DUF6492)